MRARLAAAAAEYGLEHRETLRRSEALDRWIVRYHRWFDPATGRFSPGAAAGGGDAGDPA